MWVVQYLIMFSEHLVVIVEAADYNSRDAAETCCAMVKDCGGEGHQRKMILEKEDINAGGLRHVLQKNRRSSHHSQYIGFSPSLWQHWLLTPKVPNHSLHIPAYSAELQNPPPPSACPHLHSKQLSTIPSKWYPP